MKTEPPDPLLAAVLLDGSGLRDATLRQTLALAKRRRRARTARRALAVAAVMCGLAAFLRPPPSTPPAISQTPAIPHSTVAIVRSASSSTLAIIGTPRAPFSVVKSAPGSLPMITSRPDTLTAITIRTTAPRIEYLTDRQLLAAFPDRHAALIAPGTPDARIVFY